MIRVIIDVEIRNGKIYDLPPKETLQALLDAMVGWGKVMVIPSVHKYVRPCKTITVMALENYLKDGYMVIIG